MGASAALDCAVEEIIERHSHAIVIGRVRHVLTVPGNSGLAYWDGHYGVVDTSRDAATLATTPAPTARALWEI